MEPTTTKTRDISSHPPFTTPDFTQGLYHSNTVNKDPLAVYEFAKVEANILQLFSDLPDGIENFFDLKLIDSSASSFTNYSVKYANSEKAKIKGELGKPVVMGRCVDLCRRSRWNYKSVAGKIV